MNSQKKQEPQQQPEWDRAEYETKTKGLAFTKDFQSRQEALMRDPLATVGERVMAWVLRRSWGQYRLYAIKDDGQPAYQRDCARDLKLDKKAVSHAIAYYQKRGYLENQPKKLYPVISPALSAPDPNCKKSQEYTTFLEQWKVVHSSDFQELEVARSTIKRITKVILSEYKKSKTPAKNGGASLCIESKKIKEESQSSSSAVVAVVLAAKAEEEEEPPLYQKFKGQYPADHFDEAEAKPIFEGKTKTEQHHILERLQVYLQCDRWKDDGGRWIKLASNWLQTYDADPPPALKKKAAAASAKKSYAESVREEAQRRFAKFGRI